MGGMQRHLVLSGPMGAGKSTVAPIVARALGASWLDLDDVVAREAGVPVAELVHTRGEPTFRALEADCARRLASRTEPTVIALGGGTVEDPETRAMLLERAVVVTLTAPVEVLVERASRDGLERRPMLAPSAPQRSLSRLLERRSRAYAEAHRRIDTTSGTPEEIARRIVASFQRDAASIVVRLGESSYRVAIAHGARHWLADELRDLAPTRTLLVTDEHVMPWLDDVAESVAEVAPLDVIVLPPGEASKSLHQAETIWDRALDVGLDRRSVVLALGGGVVGDVTGFAAATLLRGVRWVQVPTSLLAMVDSSVGGKTGIDHPRGKNLVGAFHQPSVVLVDPDLLTTLPERELRSALAEVVKAAWIESEDHVANLERDVSAILSRDRDALRRAIERAISTKARIVSQDEREGGVRRLLNFGHTVGHAVESASGYRLRHGEAVAIGLVAEMEVSAALGVASTSDVARMRALLEAFGLDPRLEPPIVDAFRRFFEVDKKRVGSSLDVVLAGAPGHARVERVAIERLLSLLLSSEGA